MGLIWTGLRDAFHLLITFDPLVMSAAWRSLWISTLAVAFAVAIGLPVGTALARARFRGSRLLVMSFRAGMAVPTVFIGVVCYALFSRRGPLGPLELLYSPWAIVVGELLLALPIVVAITHGAMKALDPRVMETALTLGAGRFARWRTYLSEARVGVVLAILTAFARCVTELGIAMMVGGNIKDRTRTLATATALEAGKGEFARAIAMGLLLLVIALAVTVFIVSLSKEDKE
jgi:tungstate transport system permease protein